MSVQDAYQILMDLGNVPAKAASFGSILDHMRDQFKNVTSETAKFNAAGDMIASTLTGISKSGEAATQTLKHTANGMQLVSASSSSAVADLKRSEDAIKRWADARYNAASGKGAATTGEIGNYNDSLRRIQEFVVANKVAVNDVRAIWKDVAAGIVMRYTGSLGTIQDMILKVIAAEKQLGAEATATAAKMAAAAAATTAAQRDAARRTLLGGQAVSTVTAGVKLPAIGKNPGDATAKELFNYNKSIGALQAFVEANKIGSARVQKMWTDVSNGTFNVYTGKMGELQRKLQGVKAATDAVGIATTRVAVAAQNMLLSWANITRFFEARVLYNGLTNIVSGIQQGIERATEFEQTLGRITTLAPALAGGYQEWGDSIKRVSVAFGVDATDAAKSYYTALSNQIGNSIVEIEAFTRTTSEFARVTGSTAEQSNNLFSSVINAFSKSAGDANDIAAKFFKTIDLGRVTAQGLSGSFGRTAVAASTLGVKYEELLASLSVLSRQGVTDADAQTQTLNLFNKLIKPTDALKAMIEEWGYASGQALIQNEGLVGALKRLDKELQSNGVARLGELINDIRGLRGTFGLTGKGLQEFQNDLNLITNAQADYTRAVELTALTMGQRWAKQINEVKVSFTGMGQNAIATLVPMVDYVGGLTNAIKMLVGATIAATTAIFGLRAVLGTLAAVKAAWTALGVAAGTAGAVASTAMTIATGGISLAVGALIAYFALSESNAEKIKRVYGETLESLQSATDKNIGEIGKRFDELGKNISKSFKSVFDGLRDTRAVFSETIKSIDEGFKDLRKNIDSIEQSSLSNVDDRLGDITSRISDLKSEGKNLQSALDKAFRVEALETFRDKIDDLSSGKKARAIEVEIAKVIAKQKEFAKASSLATDPVARAAAFASAEEQRKLALDLLNDLKNAGRQSIKDKESAAKDFERLTKKDTDRAQKELNLRREIATASANVAANRGTRKGEALENANRRQEQAASQLARAQEELNRHIRETNIAETAVATTRSDVYNVQSGLVKLQRLMTDAVKEEQKARADMLFLAQQEKKDLESRKDAIKKVFGGVADLLTSKDKGLTPEKTLKEVARLHSEYEKLVDVATDQTAWLQLLQVTDKIVERANAVKGIDTTDETTNRLRGLETVAKKEGDILKAKKQGLEAERQAALAGVVSGAAGLSKAFEPSAALRTDRMSAYLAYNLAVVEAKELAKLLAADPNSLKANLQQIIDMRARLEAVAVEAQALNITDNRKALDELLASITVAIGLQQRIDDTVSAESSMIEKIGTIQGALAGLKDGLSDTLGSFNKDLTAALGTANALIAANKAAIESKRTAAPQAGGGYPRFAGGGSYGSDSINARLSPGEFVVNAGASRKFYSQLIAMNSGTRNYAGGGSTTNVGDINVNMQSGGNASTDVVRIGKLLRREIKRGTVSLH